MTRNEYSVFAVVFLVAYAIPGHQTDALVGMIVLNVVAGASHAFHTWGR